MTRPRVQHTAYKKGATGTARNHADYIAGVGKNADKEDVIFLLDGNVPLWAKDAGDFFSAADEFERRDYIIKKTARDGSEYEKRVRGRAYIEFEWAIQRDIEDPIGWAVRVAEETLGKDFVYRLAVHDAPAKDGGRNLNMHLMFSDRRLDGVERTRELFFTRAKTGSYRHRATGQLVQHDPSTGGTAKDRFWNHRSRPKWARDLYEQHVQREMPGFRLTKSLSPEPKIGPHVRKAGREHEVQRQAIESVVIEMRSLRHQIEIIESALEATPDTQLYEKSDLSNGPRHDLRWPEFERSLMDIGRVEFGISWILLDKVLKSFKRRFTEVADAMEQRGEGIVHLARLIAAELNNAELSLGVSAVPDESQDTVKMPTEADEPNLD
ncbi:MAG: hypothetical protein ACXWC4_03335 [Telluria sp.]